jgi:altronate dehydratase large subunit
MDFYGFPRADGSVGVRNFIGILPTVDCCNEMVVEVANKVPGAVALPHIGRCVFLGKDQDRLLQLLIGLGKSPNLAGVVIIGTGCEPTSAEKIAQGISYSGKPVEIVTLEKAGNYKKIIQQGVKKTKHLSKIIKLQSREKFSLKYLTLAIKCGGSDTTSAIASNMITGIIADQIIDEGGTVLFTETPELIGAEDVLAKRAVNKEVNEKIYEVVARQEKRMLSMGVDVRRCEPTPGNIQGGLTTIEEKSLGAVIKSGRKPLQDVLESGQRPKEKGLYFVDGPSHTGEIYSNMAAAGAQVLLFSIGGGLPAKLPLNPACSGKFPLMPIIKMTGNPKGYLDIESSMDIYVGTIIEGKENYQEVKERAFKRLISIISGEVDSVCENFTKYYEPMNFYFEGPLI